MTELNTNTATETNANPTLEVVASVVKKSTKPKDYVTKENLTQEALKEYLELREDGFFYWVKPTVRSIAGDFAGSISPLNDKYVIVFKGTSYNGVALKQFYNEGTWPAAAVRQPKLDADGNPIVKAEKAPRVARVAPVFTAEEREAAKKAHADKLAALAAAQAAKKAQEQSKVSESDVVEQALQENPAPTLEPLTGNSNTDDIGAF